LTGVLDATAVVDAKRPTVTIDRLALLSRVSRGDILDFGLYGSTNGADAAPVATAAASPAAVLASQSVGRIGAVAMDASPPADLVAPSLALLASPSEARAVAAAAAAELSVAAGPPSVRGVGAGSTAAAFLNHFGHTFQHLQHVDRFALRQPRPLGAEPFYAFTVVFLNEHVVGEAGPWRQLFADISAELQSGPSPVLVPCPNQIAKTGENRDKFVLACHSGNLPLCEMLGVLMGCCIRTGVRLNLDLPAWVWKPLVGDPLTRVDLAAIDYATAEILKYVDGCDEEKFVATMDETFSTTLSDGTPVDLVYMLFLIIHFVWYPIYLFFCFVFITLDLL
jgi:hypothetical protein